MSDPRHFLLISTYLNPQIVKYFNLCLVSKSHSGISSMESGMGEKIATFIQWMTAFVAGVCFSLAMSWKLTLAIVGCNVASVVPVGIITKVGTFLP